MSCPTSPILLFIGTIGINNRDLHSFKVDMNASERLTTLAFTHLKEIGDDRKLCILALSGISARGDVERFQKVNIVRCLLTFPTR